MNSHPKSFHEAIAPVLFMAQLFGIMPVKGLFSPDPSELVFTWCSFRTFYSCLVITIIVFNAVQTTIYLFDNSLQLFSFETVIFIMSSVMVAINFIILARKWPNLMRKWYKIEREILDYELESNKKSLALKVRAIGFLGMAITLIQEVMWYFTKREIIQMCYDGYFMDNYFRLCYPNYYRTFGGSILSFCCTLICDWIVIFVANFMDFFVMIISVGLAMRFKSLNDSMSISKGQNMPTIFWEKHRNCYQKLCQLCEDVDNEITVMTMIAFSSNIFYMLFRIISCFRTNRTTSLLLSRIFVLSFIFLRTLYLGLFSSGINDESKQPLKILRLVPKESWCLETKRFYEDVSNNVIALTGMKLFNITRGVILSVAGLIVTYELVIYQFDHEIAKCEF